MLTMTPEEDGGQKGWIRLPDDEDRTDLTEGETSLIHPATLLLTLSLSCLLKSTQCVDDVDEA